MPSSSSFSWPSVAPLVRLRAFAMLYSARVGRNSGHGGHGINRLVYLADSYRIILGQKDKFLFNVMRSNVEDGD